MFQKKIVEKYLSKLDKDLLKQKYDLFCSIFKNDKKIENIRNSKEEQYQEGFIRDLFVSVLGYTIKPEENYNILTELKNEVANKSNSKKSDGAICEENNENKIRAVIELKGTDTTDLDKVAFQAFSYKNFHNEYNYVIVSNFERLRIYVETQIEFEEFNLFNLGFERFCILYLLLELNNLKSDIPLKLKHETLSEEKQITDNFYADYSTFKRLLFEDLIENNPETDKLLLFKKTQKLLDRILFILFCEDRNLLPPNSIAGTIKRWEAARENFLEVPLYSLFKQYFNWIDKGFENPNDKNGSIFAYNGGLFKTDEILDNIKVGDDVLYIHTRRLADYDFESQISVDILGRIFENSLTEIEEVQKEIEAEKTGAKVENNNIGKRKKDGVFYTPEYITKYIVENTIGKLCQEKRNELKIIDEDYSNQKKYKAKEIDELDARLKNYRAWLLDLKILDPACGSGAFLNAALHELRKEHKLIDGLWQKIHLGELNFEVTDNTILENNLYGVDINEESVEIAKLSLWLHTAKKSRKLTTLNGKIKCGNSLIDDPAVAGEKAFKWEEEFPEVFAKGGFDVVIGNPPYVRIQTLSDNRKGDVDFYNEKYKEVVTGNYDLYILFLYKGFNLLNQYGLLGYILPNKFFTSENGDKIRSYLYKNKSVCEIDDFTTNQIFLGATTYTALIFLNKIAQKELSHRKINLGEDFRNFSSMEQTLFDTDILNNETWIFSNQKIDGLINKIKSFEYNLGKISKKIFKGSSTGNDKIFLLNLIKENSNTITVKSAIESNEFEIEKDIVKPIIYGEDVKRYIQPQISKFVIFPYKLDENNNRILMSSEFIKNTYPLCYEYLEKNKEILLSRKIPLTDDNYFKYSAARSLNEYEQNKILIPDMLVKNRIGYDKLGTIYHNAMVHSIVFNEKFGKIDFRLFLALLNSSIFWFFIQNTSTALSGNAYRLTPEYLNPFGIPDLTDSQFSTINSQLTTLADRMLSLNETFQKKSTNFIKVVKQTFALEKVSAKMESFYELDFDGFVKELKQKITPKLKLEWLEVFEDTKKELLDLKQQIDSTDKEINSLVYQLYGLTDEEIAVVERK